VVAETFYDQQGRPTISVLPSPTIDKLIHYSPLLNTAAASALNAPVEYDKTMYDPDADAPNATQVAAPAMSSLSGASQYYSPQNPKATQNASQFIPNAEGFVFAETKYIPDNTGRILAQGGVGKNFQIGTGHETQYFYGTPLQTELDALFGTEAGIYSHYQKNMVRDANGQLSVNYVDMEGKTIATALAGATPQALTSLASASDPSSLQTDALLNATNNLVSGRSIIARTNLLVTQAGDHRFVYSFTPPLLQHVNKSGGTNCYAPVYHLLITIANNSDSMPPVVIADATNFNPDVASCSPKPFATDTVLKSLPIGSYTINKELTLVDSIALVYRDSIFVPANSLTDQAIQNQVTTKVNGNGACNVSPGVDSANNVQNTWQLIYTDVTPGVGQYAVRKVADPQTGTLSYPAEYTGFSIFDNSSSGIPFFKTPVNIGNGSYPNRYLNDGGSPDSVVVIRNGVPVNLTPDQLTEAEFNDNFKPSWATSLAYSHPEYNRMIAFQGLVAADRWEDSFRNVGSYSVAVARGYLNPTKNKTLIPAKNFPGTTDPLITLLPTYKPALESRLTSYFANSPGIGGANIWGLSGGGVGCPGDTATYACLISYNNNPFPVTFCTGELDQAWKNFRDLYLQAREQIQSQYLQTCSGCVIARMLSSNASLVFPPYVEEPIISTKERSANITTS
jgi:hypothetical protein